MSMIGIDCICGVVLEGHKCKLSHKERMIKYADYCIQNNIKNICARTHITPFTHHFNGCVVCGTILPGENYYREIPSTSKKYADCYANACNDCIINRKVKWGPFKWGFEYCFVNIETPSICRDKKPLRVLLVREIYKQHKVPRDIRNLINSLLSCGC